MKNLFNARPMRRSAGARRSGRRRRPVPADESATAAWAACCGGRSGHHTTPARIRSCTLSAPISRRSRVDDQQRGNAMSFHQLRGSGGELARADAAAPRRHDRAHRRSVHIDPAIERAAQIAVGEHPEYPLLRRQRRRSCPVPCGSFPAVPAPARCPDATRGSWSPLSHHILDVQQQSAPEAAARMRAREVLGREAARFEQRDGQRVAHRQCRGGAGGGRQIVRAGLLRQRRHRGARRPRGPAWSAGLPVRAISGTPSRFTVRQQRQRSRRSRRNWTPPAAHRRARSCPDRRGWPRRDAEKTRACRCWPAWRRSCAPTWPDLPMPVTTTRPVQRRQRRQARGEAARRAGAQRGERRRPRYRRCGAARQQL